MSVHDAYQSQFCSFRNVGLAKTNDLGDDDTLMRFSPYREEELKDMLSRIPHDMRPELDQWIRIFVKEVIELAHKNQATTSMHRVGDFELRSSELSFSDNIASPLLTGDHIKGTGGMPIKVSLVDSCTKEEVKSGPEASGRVKITVLEEGVDGIIGEDGRNEFERILVQRMEGNKSIRVVDLCLNLIEGTALLPLVSFARNKRWMKISRIRLKARFVDDFDGVRVKEAQTEPFVLMDCRNEAYKNHPIPSLHDDIWRLYNIGRNGPLDTSLRQAKIKTVGDFIVRLFLHPRCLEEIFDRAKRAKFLERTVKHARTCPAKLKYHSSFEQKTEVVFNVSGEVLGLSLDGQFLSSNILCETQKEVAKKSVIAAFENWGDVISVDEDQFGAHCSHLLNNPSSSNPAVHRLAKTENVTTCINTLATTFGKDVVLDGLDLDINESSLFENMLSDGQHQHPDFLPESLRTRYNEIHREVFETVCTSSQHEPEPVFGLVGTHAVQKNRSYKRWRILSWVVIFTIGSLPRMKSLDDTHAHKKPRLS